MNRRAHKLAEQRHEDMMDQLGAIRDAIEAIAGPDASLAPSSDQLILRAAEHHAEVAKLRVNLADREAANVTLLGEIEALKATITSEERGINAQALAEIERLKARAEAAESDLTVVRLDLNNARLALCDGRALAERREYDLSEAHIREGQLKVTVANLQDALKALEADRKAVAAAKDVMIASRDADITRLNGEIARLKALKPDPAPAPLVKIDPATGGTQIALTPLAEQVRMLTGKGHNDASIHKIVNDRRDPTEWLNLAGVKAIRELVVAHG